MSINIYWEDLVPGTVRDLGSVSVTAEDIKEFAEQFDPQPFHIDELAGKRSIFGGLCASGWHTCALAMRLSVDNFLKPLLISGRSPLPTLAVFIGVLGGLAAFGMIGLFLGPVVIALCLALIEYSREKRA